MNLSTREGCQSAVTSERVTKARRVTLPTQDQMREKRQSQGNGTSTSDVRSGACRYAIAEPVGSEARRSSLVSRHVQRRRRDVADASVLDHPGPATSGSARSRTRACRCLRCGALLKPRQVLWIQVDLTSIVDHHPRILLQELGLRNRLRPALRKHPRSLITNETSVQHGSVTTSLGTTGIHRAETSYLRLRQRPFSVACVWPSALSMKLRFRRFFCSICPVAGSTGTRRPVSVQK